MENLPNLPITYIIVALISAILTGFFTYKVKMAENGILIRRSDLESFTQVTSQWEELANEYKDRWLRCEDQIKILGDKAIEQAILITKLEAKIAHLERKIELNAREQHNTEPSD